VDRTLLARHGQEATAMERRVGLFFLLTFVGAVIGFGRFAPDALAAAMRVLFVAALLLMLASVLFGRRAAR
jgi:uncharacterized membrane protein YtjA (UPF0391 family)